MNRTRAYRSSDERVLAGVAGGLAEYFKIDPLLIRIGFIALAFVEGLGIILYIALLLLMPKKSEDKDQGSSGGGRQILGLIVMVLGVLILFSNTLRIVWLDWEVLWPSVLIVIGAYLAFTSGKKRKEPVAHSEEPTEEQTQQAS